MNIVKILLEVIWLKVDLFSKKIDGEFLLDKIIFEVKLGEIIGIVGWNGVGKIIFFWIIMGFYIFDEGDVYLDEVLSKNF